MNKKRSALWMLAAAAVLAMATLGMGGCAGGVRLDGTALDKFTVVYPEQNLAAERLAREFCAAVEERHEISLDCIPDTREGTREILIGKTSRTPETYVPAGQFSVFSWNGDVVLDSDSASGLFAATERLLSDLGAGSADYKTTVTEDYVDRSVRVMSFNLRTVDVNARIDRVKSVIARNDPDLLGVQEASSGWQPVMKALEGYTCVGIGRDGANDEACFVLFKTDKFTLIDSGTRWYTETPDKPSVLDGSSYRRIYTYAFLERADGTRFLYINTHMHLHMASRIKAAEFLLAFLEETFPDVPAYITGDFNTNTDQQGSKYVYYDPGAHEDFDTLLMAAGFENSRLVASETDSHGTYPTDLYPADNVGGAPSSCFHKGEGDIIDYCMVRGSGEQGILVDRYYVDSALPDAGEPQTGLGNAASDHYPIVSETVLYRRLCAKAQ